MQTVIWWIRRDLRIKNNPTLQAADPENRRVLSVFILDPVLLKRDAKKRKAFLFEGLRRLDEQLRTLGSRLILRAGKPTEELLRLTQESGAAHIYAEEDYSPYSRKRDQEVASRLSLQLVLGLTVYHPNAVKKQDGTPYTVFTPFSKAWKSLPQPDESIHAPTPHFLQIPDGIHSLPIPDAAPVEDFPAGEKEAEKRLQDFLRQRIDGYRDERDRLDLNGTSVLSPYFRFGMLSIRQAVSAAINAIWQAPNDDARAGAEAWLNELIWREFYQSILYHFSEVMQKAFRHDLQWITWRDSSVELNAWKKGLTGYPVVDASMRQLATLGWMHNRGRMITASFLVKDLLINWQEGEEWFMQQLVDGDPASNNGGWQWTAGVGTDAAPYFRIFNPVLQGKRFDPEGGFVRQWVPELVNVPLKYIHEPWRMPLEVQLTSGCVLGKDYPLPIVNHKAARSRTLEAYRKSKSLSSGNY